MAEDGRALVLGKYRIPRPPDSRPLPPPTGAGKRNESKRPRCDVDGFFSPQLDAEQQEALQLLEKYLESTLDFSDLVWTTEKISGDTESRSVIKLFRAASCTIDMNSNNSKKVQQQQPQQQKKKKSSNAGDSSDSDRDQEKRARLASVAAELDPTSQMFANAWKKSTPSAPKPS